MARIAVDCLLVGHREHLVAGGVPELDLGDERVGFGREVVLPDVHVATVVLVRALGAHGAVGVG